MGFYLNSKRPGLLFQEEVHSTYFVDKTALLNELIPLVEPEKTERKFPGRTEEKDISMSASPGQDALERQ